MKRLAEFPELFKRVQSRRWVTGYIDSTPLQPTHEQKVAVAALNRWRTGFVHYKPMSLSIEVRGFPRIVERCLEVIEFLAFRSGHVFRIPDELGQRTKSCLAETSGLLREINDVYENS